MTERYTDNASKKMCLLHGFPCLDMCDKYV